MKVLIEIQSDNDFDVYSSIGTFHAFGPDLKHTIVAPNEDEMRKEIVWFLAQLEIRQPYEQEYDSCRSLYGTWISAGHDTSFKMMIYEAIHQIASGGDFEFHRGGNRELHIEIVYT